jgi:hypothetical protein
MTTTKIDTKQTTIDLQNFLFNKRILHDELSNNYSDAIKYLIKNKDNADIITYENTRHFSLLNVSVLEKDADGKFFYQFGVERDGDIIDNICYETISGIPAQLSYYIGGYKYMPEEVDKFVIASSVYHDFQIRVTFLEKQTCNDEFKILSRYYLVVNTEDRKKLATSIVETENIIYSDGMTRRKAIGIDTIQTSLGQNHNIKNMPPTPKNSVSP